MEYEILDMNEKIIAGLCARTNNSAPDMPQVIGGLWTRLYGEGLHLSMYNIIADLHTHSLASTHAYSTIREMVDSAAEKGLKAIAITDPVSYTHLDVYKRQLRGRSRSLSPWATGCIYCGRVPLHSVR